MMKNKGFTLVELAIVLVVIGVIMGMAIKGKSLIDVAKMRSEVAKIQRVKTGVTLYYAKNSKSLPYSNTNYAGMDMRALVDAGILSVKDLNSPYIENLTTPYGITAFSTGMRQYTGGVYFYADNTTVGSGNITLIFRPFERLACVLEVTTDDSNPFTGESRYFNNEYPASTTQHFMESFEDCYTKAENKRMNSGGDWGLLYGTEVY